MKHFTVLATALALLDITCPAMAQEVAGADPEIDVNAPAARILDEVTVTAQKRVENLQNVPAAISAFQAPYLELAEIRNVEQIAQRTPGLTVTRFNATQPQIYIRGIGSTDQSASGDPSVGVFVDGVYIPRPGAMDLDYFDLERVEVLRGPQGALYGKNVVGGAINLITGRPSENFGARVEGGIGADDLRSIRARIEGALSENVTSKLAVSGNRRDGYARNALTGNELSDENSAGARGQILFARSPDFDVLVGFDYSRDRLAGNNRECLGEQFIFFPWFAPGSPFAPTPCSPDPYINEKTVDGFQNRDIWGASATATANTSFGEFVSITAYRASKVDFQEDFDGSDAPLVIRNVTDESRQLSQEFRLSSRSEGTLDWLIGYYFSDTDIDRLENNDFSGNNVPLNLPAPLSFNTFYFQDNRTRNHALFGQVGWHLGERTLLTTGARYTYESKDARLRTAGFDPTRSFLVAPYDVSPSESWSAFTPSASLSYHFRPQTMGYIAYSEGFKSGGFNGTARDATSALAGFDQEKARQLEFGVKTSFLDQRARANLTAFHIDYTDLQVFQLVNGASLVVSNAADATSRGVELELEALLSDNWMLQASYGYLDAKFDRFINESGQDFSGNRLTRAPKNSYNLGLTYTRAVGGWGTLTVHGEYSYRSRIFFEPNNFALVGDPSLGLLDMKVALEFSNNWEVALWGKNLTDEVYAAQAIDGRGPFNLSQNAAATLGMPRLVGLTLGYRY